MEAFNIWIKIIILLNEFLTLRFNFTSNINLSSPTYRYNGSWNKYEVEEKLVIFYKINNLNFKT